MRPHDTAREAARQVLARQLDRLRRNEPGTRAGEDPEALHDMRVATRRLRAAARIFEASLPARLRRGLRGELRWLARLLGPVRDLDVQRAKLESFAAAAPAESRAALDCLRDHLAGERARRRDEMIAGLDAVRYSRLLQRLDGFCSVCPSRRARDPAAREPIAGAGRRAIRKAFRRLTRRGERTGAVPRAEDLHALRIRAKRLRYLLEFLQELTGEPGRRLVKRLTRLQDLLGGFHDAVVAADVARAFVEKNAARLEPAQRAALDALLAAEVRLAEEQRAAFEETWRRFAGSRTSADWRAVLDNLGELLSQAEPPTQGPGARAPGAGSPKAGARKPPKPGARGTGPATDG